MNMKSLCTCLSLVFLSVPFGANAKPLACPFTDYFSISATSDTRILDVAGVMGNLLYTQKSEGTFTLSCLDSSKTSSGDIVIEIGTENVNKCSIKIHDGPFVNNPSVSDVSCVGNMNFIGVDHAFGTYRYTLKFSAE